MHDEVNAGASSPTADHDKPIVQPAVEDLEEKASNPEDSENSDHASEGEGGGDCHNECETSTVIYDQEPFEELRQKVVQLCVDLGLGEPSEVERMSGGDLHRVVGLAFPFEKHPSYVLRMPRFLYEDWEQHETCNQVAIIKLFRQKLPSLPVPLVYAYDSTANNAVGRQFVAEVIAKFESVALPYPGRLISDKSLPLTLHTTPSTEAGIEIAGYRKTPKQDLKLVEKCDLTDFLTQLFDQCHRMVDYLDKEYDRIKEIVQQMKRAGFTRKYDTDNVLYVWDLSLSNLLIQQRHNLKGHTTPTINNTRTESASVTVTEDKHKHSVRLAVEGPTTLGSSHTVDVSIEDSCGKTYSHVLKVPSSPDTGRELPQHTLTQSDHISSWDISGVLDLDDIKTAPRVLVRTPPSWLWIHPNTRHSGWMGDNDEPSQQQLPSDELLIKAQFDQTMARLSPTYIEDAYHRGYWLRRLSRFAITGFRSNECFKHLEVFSDEWSKYYDSLVLD